METQNNAELIQKAMRSKGCAEIAVIGNSMNPILEEGDIIKVVSYEEYVPGDIILCIYENDSVLVRRLLKIDVRYFCKGDNSFKLENIEKEQILGKVIEINDRAVPIWRKEMIELSLEVSRSYISCDYSIEKTMEEKVYQEYITRIQSVFNSSVEDKLYLMISAMRYRMAAPVFEALSDYPYAVVKGEPLSQMAYGRLGARKSGDIDVLIPRSAVKYLETVLVDNGFKTNQLSRADRLVAFAGAHQTSPYTKVSSAGIAAQIDINFDIFWGEYTGERISIEEFLADTTEMTIYGTKVKILSPEKTLVQMTLHHYKDINSYFHYEGGNPIRRELFRDMYKFLCCYSDFLNPRVLMNIAEKYGIRPYLFYMLYYTSILFTDSRLKQCLEFLECEPGIALLDCYGLADNERKKWNVDFYTRLASNNFMDLIKKDMTASDFQKLRRSKKIFT